MADQAAKLVIRARFLVALVALGFVLLAGDGRPHVVPVSAFLAPALSSTLGKVFRLNATTAGDQRWPDIAVSDDGALIAAGWASYGQHALGWSAMGQRFDNGGNRLGGEFALDDFRGVDWPNTEDPAIDFDGYGNFVVAWHSYGTDDGDGGWTIWVRRYRADGSPTGPAQRVPTQTGCDQWRPTVMTAANGETLITWYVDLHPCVDNPPVYSEIRGRVLRADNSFAGDELLISGAELLTRSQWRQGACNRAGIFVPHWYGQEPASWYARVFSSGGATLSQEVRFYQSVSVGVRANGDWLAVHGGGGQWYAPGGAQLGTPFPVTGDELAMNDLGQFVTLGYENGPNGLGLYAYPYGANGLKAGPQILMTSGHGGFAGPPHIDMSENGVIVVAWEALHNSDGDGAASWGSVALHPHSPLKPTISQ